MVKVCKGYHQQHHQPAMPFVEQASWCSKCQGTGKKEE